MGRPRFLQIIVVAALLAICFSNGFGRILMESGENGHSSVHVEESTGKSRMMIQVMDYDEPGPNTNPKTGALLTPPPPQN